jgi:hypothetical protein
MLRSSALLLTATLAACSSAEPPPAPGTTGTIVLGVTGDLRAGVDFDTLHARVEVDGKQVLDKSFTGVSLHLPLTIPTSALPEGADVRFDLDVSRLGSSFLTRAAETKVRVGHALLLPVSIDLACIDQGQNAGPSYPVCEAPKTCSLGKCIDPYVDSARLHDFTSDWAQASDACKPKNAGAPVVTVGEGMSDYLPMNDLDVAQIEAGPQGGHHVWIAIRQKNLKQSGSITTVSGSIPDLGIDIEPLAVVFTFNPDEGGYCKLYGLRFQLDQSHKIEDLFGHELDIDVSVTDADGVVGDGKRRVMLSASSL